MIVGVARVDLDCFASVNESRSPEQTVIETFDWLYVVLIWLKSVSKLQLQPCLSLLEGYNDLSVFFRYLLASGFLFVLGLLGSLIIIFTKFSYQCQQKISQNFLLTRKSFIFNGL